VVARELHRHGVAVEVCMPLPVKPDDGRWALETAQAAGVPLGAAVPDRIPDCAWAVDGLFGIGLSRPIDGVYAALAGRLAARAERGAPVLALDVPSGLDSDTGNPAQGGPAVRATHTVTFIGAKPGLYTGAGRDLAGTVLLAPLGLGTRPEPGQTQAPAPEPSPGQHAAPGNGTAEIAAVLNAPALFQAHFPARTNATHKGTFGSLAVVGGATGMCGAPILAARAALFAGSGKVHVAFLGHDSPPYDAPHPELMLHRAAGFDLGAMNALAIGPGMGESWAARGLLRKLLALGMPKVVDADALNLIARHADLGTLLQARPAAVMTPHPLEAARLLGTDVATVQRDRLQAARQLARRFGCVIVLKGSGTIIAATDGRLAVNPTGNAALATGGTGDVLSGIIGAFLAQRLPCYEAALAGVYLHGGAADALRDAGTGPAGLSASELAPAVRTILNQLLVRASH
jgi:hydroxyethylthiazole kinase-like uncharacterized protein yjeF